MLTEETVGRDALLRPGPPLKHSMTTWIHKYCHLVLFLLWAAGGDVCERWCVTAAVTAVTVPVYCRSTLHYPTLTYLKLDLLNQIVLI